MSEYLTSLNMRVVTCACGLTWAAPEKWFRERQKNHKIFYCPNGCQRYFPDESDEERLERLLRAFFVAMKNGSAVYLPEKKQTA